MADKKVSQLDALADPTTDDYLYVVSDPAGTPVSKRITIGQIVPLVGGVPVGAILMWGGPIADIPTGWALCDGEANAPGPDLRDRFIVGASEDDSGVAKTNVEGTLKQTGGVTGVQHSAHAQLVHSGGAVGDHTGLTHGLTIADHPDLTHPALSHPAMTLAHPDHTIPTISGSNASHAAGSLPALDVVSALASTPSRSIASGADISGPSRSIASRADLSMPSHSHASAAGSRPSLSIASHAAGSLPSLTIASLANASVPSQAGVNSFSSGVVRSGLISLASIANASVPSRSIASRADISGPTRSIASGADVSVPSATGASHAAGSLPSLTIASHAAGSRPSLAIASGEDISVPSQQIASRADLSMPSASHSHASMALAHADHSVPSLSHQAIGDHKGSDYGVHSVTAPAAHGTAGTVTHAYTEPSPHDISAHDVVLSLPVYYALAFIQRMAA